MSGFIDAITLIMALYTLVLYSGGISRRAYSAKNIIAGLASGLYIIAQVGWTSSFLSGNVWGAEFNNYFWFLFNTLVFAFFILMGIEDESDQE